MAIRLKHESTSDIGVYACLTNTYCLVAEGPNENFYSALEAELADNIPVIRTTIAGTVIVGSCCIGNKNGLLVPESTTDQELMNLRNSLPDRIEIRRIEERLNALGNTIATNDYAALCHVDMEKSSEEIIEQVLGVEVFRSTINNEVLVGQYVKFSNIGGLIHPLVSSQELNSISQLLQVPLTRGTVNGGSEHLAAGLLLNDWCAFVGEDSTFAEMRTIEQVCKLNRN